MVEYYPLVNTCISLFLAYCVAGVTLTKITKFKIATVIVVGAVLPLLVLFVTKNFDSVCFCIEALANLYTLTTLVYYSTDTSSIIFASTSNGNTGSSVEANVANSTGAGASSHSNPNQELADNQAEAEATNNALIGALFDVHGDTGEGNNRALVEQLVFDTRNTQEQQFLESSRSKGEYEKMIIQQKKNEATLRTILDNELEIQKWLKEAADSKYAKYWERNQDSPEDISKLLERSIKDIMRVLGIDEDEKKSICNTCSKVVDHKSFFHKTISERIARALEYKNLLAKITEQQAVLDEIEERKLSKHKEQDMKTSRANLGLGKAVVKDQMNKIQNEFNSNERKR